MFYEFKRNFKGYVKHKTKILFMKKSFFLIAYAVLSMSVFAQTPQTTSSKSTTAKHSTKVKTDHSNTKNSKATLSKDQSKLKFDNANKASAKTKKMDKKQVKADKSTVKANKKTEKKDKKAVAKKTTGSSSTGSLSSAPKQ
jgi:hypothetical protein